jgi:hypothetical protein
MALRKAKISYENTRLNREITCLKSDIFFGEQKILSSKCDVLKSFLAVFEKKVEVHERILPFTMQ